MTEPKRRGTPRDTSAATAAARRTYARRRAQDACAELTRTSPELLPATTVMLLQELGRRGLAELEQTAR